MKVEIQALPAVAGAGIAGKKRWWTLPFNPLINQVRINKKRHKVFLVPL